VTSPRLRTAWIAWRDGPIYLWVDDVEAVAAEFGATIENTPWARDCEITDPDGNRVRAGTRTQP
jgi:hypothetical protein